MLHTCRGILYPDTGHAGRWSGVEGEIYLQDNLKVHAFLSEKNGVPLDYAVQVQIFKGKLNNETSHIDFVQKRLVLPVVVFFFFFFFFFLILFHWSSKKK